MKSRSEEGMVTGRQAAISHYDVVIIGAGPSGSIAGALLRRRGWKVLVLEGQRFPRFSMAKACWCIAWTSSRKPE